MRDYQRHRSRHALTSLVLLAATAMIAACSSDNEADTTTAAAGTTATSAATDAVETTEAAGTTDAVETTEAAGTTDDTDTTEAEASGSRFSLLDAPEGEATGDPIVIGWTNIDEGPLTFPAFTEGFDAAIAYINDHGGVHGRPLEAVKCAATVAPESSQNCAVKINEANPIVAMEGLDFARGSLYQLLEASGTPAAGGLPATPDDFNAKNTYFFYNGAYAQYTNSAAFIVNTLGAKNVVVMDSNTAAAVANIQTYFMPAVEALGATVTQISEDPSAADFTSQASQVIAANPDVVELSTGGTACVGSVTSLRTLGYDGPINMAASCTDNTVFEAIDPSLMHDVYYVSEFYDPRAIENLDGAPQQELQVFLDAMAKYAPDAALAEFTQVGFASVINVAQIMSDLPSDSLNAEELSKALAAQTDEPNFTADVYTCGGKLVPVQPSQCSSSAITYDWNGGKPTVASDGFVDANSIS